MILSRLIRLSVALITLIALIAIPTWSESPREKRVAGASTLAKSGQFPHVVFFYWYWHIQPFRQITRFKCTANILTPNYIVTAAHCYFHLLFTYRNFSSELDFVRNLTEAQGLTFIRAGCVDGWERESGWQDRQGEKVLIPNTYLKPSTMFDLDVCLVYLPVAFIVDQPAVSHVALARRSMPIGEDEFRDCVAAGYGYQSHNEAQVIYKPKMKYGDMSVAKNKLRAYPVKVGRERYCKYLQHEMDKSVIYFDTFYACGKSPGNRTARTFATACFGDGGGPLMCHGLLTGLLVQRRESSPCDFARGTAFAMFTLLGAPEVDQWIKKHIPEVPPAEQLPPWDPWNVTVAPGHPGHPGAIKPSLALRTGQLTEEAGHANDSIDRATEEAHIPIGKDKLNVAPGHPGAIKPSLALRTGQLTEGTGHANGSIDRATEEAHIPIGKEKLNVAPNSSDALGGKHVEKDEGKKVQVLIKAAIDKDFNLNDKILVDDSVGRVKRNVTENADVLKDQLTQPPRERLPQLARNANGKIMDGELKDDDPDLMKLMELIRSGVEGDVTGDAERKKRQAAGVRLKEEMARDLLMGVRDLDPGALVRLGMEASVLTSEDLEEDEWARAVWKKAYGEDV